MPDPFIGEIKTVSFNFAPVGWAMCDGQLLPISQHNALFSLVGTTYGGDGRTTFGLPDLRGRYAMHPGTGPGLTPRSWGAKSGVEDNTLSINNMPSHNHSGAIIASSDEGDRTDPTDAYLARPEEPVQPYAGSGGSALSSGSLQINDQGNGQAFTNMPPFLAVYHVIALVGVYPSRP